MVGHLIGHVVESLMLKHVISQFLSFSVSQFSIPISRSQKENVLQSSKQPQNTRNFKKHGLNFSDNTPCHSDIKLTENARNSPQHAEVMTPFSRVSSLSAFLLQFAFLKVWCQKHAAIHYQALFCVLKQFMHGT
jgi:hypothetical protein